MKDKICSRLRLVLVILLFFFWIELKCGLTPPKRKRNTLVSAALLPYYNPYEAMMDDGIN